MVWGRWIASAILFASAVVSGVAFGSAEEEFARGIAAYHDWEHEKAYEIFGALAEQGHAPAQAYLGHLYLRGVDVPQDFDKAARWYRQSAEQGHAPGQEGLATLYVDGLGVPQDFGEAERWLRRAADQGYASAKNNLGVLYQNGWGVPQDMDRAARWYRRAAEQGYPLAQASLGHLYALDRKLVQAYMWADLAASQGIVTSLIEELDPHMTRGQVAEAQRRARVCLESNYARCD